MSLKLEGKVAIVTGASKGIGAGIAKDLANAGAKVAVNYASDKAGADKTVSEITANGGQAIAVQGSVTSTEDIARIFGQAKEAFGNIDIVVNNAGIYKFDAVQDVTAEEFDRQFHTNVLGPILTTGEALKHFPETGGSIINISSVIATSPSPNAAVYAATKGALDTLTKTLALELAPKKIRVNTVSPGITETEGTHTAGVIGSEFEAQLVATTPLGRLGQPQDIAGIVTFLASDDAGWITGQRVNASGGL